MATRQSYPNGIASPAGDIVIPLGTRVTGLGHVHYVNAQGGKYGEPVVLYLRPWEHALLQGVVSKPAIFRYRDTYYMVDLEDLSSSWEITEGESCVLDEEKYTRFACRVTSRDKPVVGARGPS